MTLFWADTQPITMKVNGEELPHFFIWQERRYAVKEVVNQWNVDTDWWTKRIWRDYFKLVTEDENLFLIYHDLCSGGWFLHRTYN
jgi:hypothetical protein